MHIVIDARFYGRLGKGLGRYTEKLIAYLERIDRHNRYTVLLRRENFDDYVPGSERFTKALADYQWYSWEEQWRLPRHLASLRPDLVHFPHFNVPVLYRGRFVVTIHDLILLHYPTRRGSTLGPLRYAFKYAAYRQVIRSAVRRAARILTVSRFTENDIRRHYRVSPPGKIAVTYEAAEAFCGWNHPDEEAAFFARVGLAAASGEAGPRGILEPYLLYVGNAYPHKNLDRLVRAAAREAARGLRLVLVGKPDHFYRALRRIADAHQAANVLFVGEVSDQELAMLYRYARGYVFPSLYEGFGLPPLEASLYGVPVAAARTPALTEILGGAALYFDPADEDSLQGALATIWEEAPLRERLGALGREHAARYSWERMARETLQVYEAVSSPTVKQN